MYTKKRQFDGYRSHAGVLAELADRFSGRILEVTTPIYSIDGSARPSHEASAVFFAIGAVKFLVSAAHVLDKRHSQILYVHGVSGLVPISGDFTRLYSSSAPSPDLDPIDLTVVRLHPKTVEQVSSTSFARWGDLNHSKPNTSRDVFATLGYPSIKQVGAFQENELRAAAYRMLGLECHSPAYQKLEHDHRTSLMIGFDHRRMWGPEGQVTAPHMRGMSGSGVWRVGEKPLRPSTTPLLSGIMVEWHPKASVKHILATRIQAVIAAVVDRYEDVAENVKLLVGGAA